jgi:sialic acid synthase SpsE
MPIVDNDIFEELFVLELANNHWGSLERGLKIIEEFGIVVRYNSVKTAIKLQFRDVDTFIHRDFLHREDIRYIQKTLATRIGRDDMAKMVEAVRQYNCVRMATPFDEKSVDLCCELEIDIIKVASADVTDWVLLEKIAKTHKPVIISTGGTSMTDINNIVLFFENRNIPLAINHCVAIYPSQDCELEMNQIDFLKRRYPDHVIGFSTHECHDWVSSIMIAYAKGARTFERHIDIKTGDRAFSPYCSTPEQIDVWFKALQRAKEMCGQPGTAKAISSEKEIQYLDTLVRGVYAKRDIAQGEELSDDNIYLAIPLQKGQLSCREIIRGMKLIKACSKDKPLSIDLFDNPYSRNAALREVIMNRGI